MLQNHQSTNQYLQHVELLLRKSQKSQNFYQLMKMQDQHSAKQFTQSYFRLKQLLSPELIPQYSVFLNIKPIISRFIKQILETEIIISPITQQPLRIRTKYGFSDPKDIMEKFYKQPNIKQKINFICDIFSGVEEYQRFLQPIKDITAQVVLKVYHIFYQYLQQDKINSMLENSKVAQIISSDENVRSLLKQHARQLFQSQFSEQAKFLPWDMDQQLDAQILNQKNRIKTAKEIVEKKVEFFAPIPQHILLDPQWERIKSLSD